MFLLEAAAFHVLRLVLTRLQTPGYSAQLIRVRAGDVMFCRRMNDWYVTGELRLVSQVAAEIVSLCTAIAESLRCPLLFEPAEHASIFRELQPAEVCNMQSLVAAARLRLKHQIIEESLSEWGESWADSPHGAGDEEEDQRTA